MGKRKTNKSSEANSSSKKPKSTIESFFSPIVSLPKSKASSTKPPDANLDQEQIKIWRMIVDEEKNVFFTGAAGR
jgi:ATP-dependent DNA helicase PIF1